MNFVFFIKVKSKSKYRILNFVFQFIKRTKWRFGYTHCIAPPIMNSLFTLHLNQHNLRNYQEFFTEKRNTVNYGLETVTYRVPILWPKLPWEYKLAGSLTTFKSKIKYWKCEICNCRLCKEYQPSLAYILNNKSKSHSIFLFYSMLELESNARWVAFQKDPEKG